jgi:hypothetical protein
LGGDVNLIGMALCFFAVLEKAEITGRTGSSVCCIVSKYTVPYRFGYIIQTHFFLEKKRKEEYHTFRL